VKPYRFLATALVELDHAARWYQRRSPSAAEKFLTTIERTLVHVRTMPQAAPRWPNESVDADVRSLPIAEFPYMIVYLNDDDGIVVLAVAHGHRRPGYWLRRLKRQRRRT
jgi:plasmid stabilization system protein ParE